MKFSLIILLLMFSTTVFAANINLECKNATSTATVSFNEEFMINNSVIPEGAAVQYSINGATPTVWTDGNYSLLPVYLGIYIGFTHEEDRLDFYFYKDPPKIESNFTIEKQENEMLCTQL